LRTFRSVLPVDVFVPGCPSSADTIYKVLSDLITGHKPEGKSDLRFGA
jgi:NAD-reducing hydrogenase small subunit